MATETFEVVQQGAPGQSGGSAETFVVTDTVTEVFEVSAPSSGQGGSVNPADIVPDTVVLVEREMMTEQVVELHTIELVNLELIEVENTVIELIEVAEQGPPGPPGAPGVSGAVATVKTAGVALSALTVVYELDGEVYPLSCFDTAHVDLLAGLTTTAALAGQPVMVQALGDITDAGFGFTPGRVYLGMNGALTQTPPAAGFDVLVGAATAGNRLLLNFQDPIELE